LHAVGILTYQQGLTGDQAKNGMSRSAERFETRVGSKAKTFRLNSRTFPRPVAFDEAAAELSAQGRCHLCRQRTGYTRRLRGDPHHPIVAIDFTTDPVAEGYVESYGRQAET